MECLSKGDIDISLTYSQFLAKCFLAAKNRWPFSCWYRTDTSSLACFPWSLQRQRMVLVSCLRNCECRTFPRAVPTCKARIKDAVDWLLSLRMSELGGMRFHMDYLDSQKSSQAWILLKGLRCSQRGENGPFCFTARSEAWL